jgi:hypothetical protein
VGCLHFITVDGRVADGHPVPSAGIDGRFTYGVPDGGYLLTYRFLLMLSGPSAKHPSRTPPVDRSSAPAEGIGATVSKAPVRITVGGPALSTRRRQRCDPQQSTRQEHRRWTGPQPPPKAWRRPSAKRPSPVSHSTKSSIFIFLASQYSSFWKL